MENKTCKTCIDNEDGFCGEPIDLPYGKSCSVCRKRFKKLADGVTHDNKYWRQDNKIIFGGNDNERS